ncbi:MAG: LPS-assembly protein LptD [Prevotella sp.]|nr:LPS-assembly protein LptD [Prevotella sp.]
MACTPSSLRPGKAMEEVRTEDIVSVPQVKIPQVKVPEQLNDSVTLPALLDSIASKQDIDSLASLGKALADSLSAQVPATEEHIDAAPLDSIIPPGAASAIKTKRDTTTMDSVELAIYKYNKVVDDSLARDSINKNKKNGIDSPVEYSADDSLTYDATKSRAYLYGNSKVKYQNMDLASENIFMSLDSNVVHATGKRDTTNNDLTGTPVFKMGSDTYESDTMAFNFKTKKGLITSVYTQQEDGYLTSELSKRGANGEMFLQHGRYTTCDDPHPDFYIAMSRAKVRPGKDVVFGPAYLVVADVPLPLAVPYGFFPFSKSYASGFIMPTYGDETERGFYLRDGGYYFAISDKMDLKLLGEIYTKGSWGISAASNYRKRYKYSGSFYASYLNTITGEKNMPDYAKQTSFKLQWSHRQDQKANPFSSLSASVNFASTSYERNNLTSMYNPQAMTQSQRTSNIAYSTNFSSIGLSLSSTVTLSQNMRDSTISLSLPGLDVSLSRFYPFKRKKAAGDERWYEKISLSYSGNFSNSIDTKEDRLLHSDFRKDWRNGMKHSIRSDASFTLMNYLNVTPSFSLTDRTSFIKQQKSWDTAAQQEVTDTITGFYNVYDWNMSLNLSTKLYGFWVPNRKLFGEKVQAIRHVVSPSIAFSYHPDFGASRYGYYTTYQKTDADGNVSLVEYSPYSIGLYSAPGKGKAGSLNFDIGNNLEMKVKSEDDSTGYKKISLIDELRLSMSYNLATDIKPLSNLNANLRLKLTKSYTFNLNAVFASYVYEADSVGATPRESDHTTYWQQGKIGRFQGMSQNLSYTLDNTKVSNFFKWLRGEKVEKKKDNKKRRDDEDEEDEWDNEAETNIDKDLEEGKHGAERKSAALADTDEDGYMAFQMPWSISFGYGITMREGNDVSKFNYNTMRYPYTFTQNLNISGNLRISDGWNISFSSGYDFDNHKISMTTASLSRDLHCFNMSCSVVLAPYTSYNFSFRCNAATLTDALKYDKRSSYSNAVQWY